MSLVFNVFIALIVFMVLSYLKDRYALHDTRGFLIQLGVGCLLWMFFVLVAQKWVGPEPVDEGNSTQGVRVAVTKKVLNQPLLTEVDFKDGDVQKPKTALVVNLPLASITFNDCGAVVTHYECKQRTSEKDKNKALSIWSTDIGTEREQSAFLVALDEATPLQYTLVKNDLEGSERVLIFQASSDQGTIEKEFRLSLNSYQIDVYLRMTPHAHQKMRPRIFLPAPYLGMELTSDAIQGVLYSDEGKFAKFVPSHLEGRLWTAPHLFGSEDRYFVSAVVKDANTFIERAYYRLNGAQRVTAILEGPEISEAKTWKLSFYVGPKEVAAMQKVDERLTAVLEYGWFRPISLVLSKALLFVNTYVNNFGWSIIILALLLKLFLMPLTIRADRSQKRMGEMQKRLQAIERKYKDDPARRDQEKVELIKKHGVGDILGLGMGLRLLQLFIYVGLNRVLAVSYELFRAPFFGWITDLSAVDSYYVLPGLMGVGIFLQMRNVTDPKQFVTILLFCFVITGIMLNLAAGLVLFLCISTWTDVLYGMYAKKGA